MSLSYLKKLLINFILKNEVFKKFKIKYFPYLGIFFHFAKVLGPAGLAQAVCSCVYFKFYGEKNPIKIDSISVQKLK